MSETIERLNEYSREEIATAWKKGRTSGNYTDFLSAAESFKHLQAYLQKLSLSEPDYRK